MNRRPVVALAVVQVLLAGALFVVAWAGVERARQVSALQAELAVTRQQLSEAITRAEAAEDRANQLQQQVDQLSALLRAAGVAVPPPPRPSSSHTPSPTAPVSPSAPAAAPSPQATPAAPTPAPSRSPSPSSSPSPRCSLSLAGLCLP